MNVRLFLSIGICFVLAGNVRGETEVGGTASPNEGFVHTDSGNLVFSTNGTARMTINTSGNVGIGTAPGTNKLTVGGVFNGISGAYVDSLTTNEIGSWSTASATFVDLPNSSKSITIPSGTAVILWTTSNLSAAGAGDYRIRPVIGASAPADGVSAFTNEASQHKTYSGTWVTSTGGGAVTVKLQVRVESGGALTVDANDLATWTLMVFRN